jgi:hypothetical protein
VPELAAGRLSPGDHFVGDAAAEITALRQVAEEVPAAQARTEILKAVAVLQDTRAGGARGSRVLLRKG